MIADVFELQWYKRQTVSGTCLPVLHIYTMATTIQFIRLWRTEGSNDCREHIEDNFFPIHLTIRLDQCLTRKRERVSLKPRISVIFCLT